MICDKYRVQTALYFPVLLRSAFSQRSDFKHFTPMMESGSSYEEKYLTHSHSTIFMLAHQHSHINKF
jgi:hypothetical protein